MLRALAHTVKAVSTRNDYDERLANGIGLHNMHNNLLKLIRARDTMRTEETLRGAVITTVRTAFVRLAFPLIVRALVDGATDENDDQRVPAGGSRSSTSKPIVASVSEYCDWPITVQFDISADLHWRNSDGKCAAQ